MPQYIVCEADTKFEGGLCYPCYQKDKNQTKQSSETTTQEVIESTSGLTDKERNYRYNMIKGRIAETLIQELF